MRFDFFAELRTIRRMASLPAKKSTSSARLAGYRHKVDRLREDCPLRAAVDVVRGRWKPSILFYLRDGAKRFTELQAALPGVTAQTLTVQLRQLEADEIVHRTVYSEIPARVEYTLTVSGQSLAEVADQLEAWGVAYLRRQANAEADR